eukprot:6835007-Prymnesium_polylepis.1
MARLAVARRVGILRLSVTFLSNSLQCTRRDGRWPMLSPKAVSGHYARPARELRTSNSCLSNIESFSRLS